MLRLYFLQQWYGLADEALEDALYDSQVLRGFAGIDLAVTAVPDATTVLNFRPLAGGTRLDPGAVRRDRGDAGGARPVEAPGHNCRCHDHRRAAFDQEQKQGPRSGEAPSQEGQPVAFRHEGAYRGGCRRSPRFSRGGWLHQAEGAAGLLCEVPDQPPNGGPS